MVLILHRIWYVVFQTMVPWSLAFKSWLCTKTFQETVGFLPTTFCFQKSVILIPFLWASLYFGLHSSFLPPVFPGATGILLFRVATIRATLRTMLLFIFLLRFCLQSSCYLSMVAVCAAGLLHGTILFTVHTRQ